MNDTALVKDELLDELRVHCIDFDDGARDGSDSIPGVPLSAPDPSVTAACPAVLLRELRDWAGATEDAITRHVGSPPSGSQPRLARSELSPSVEAMLRAYVADADGTPRPRNNTPRPRNNTPRPRNQTPRSRNNTEQTLTVETNPMSPPNSPRVASRGHREPSPWLHRDVLEERLRALEMADPTPSWVSIRQALGLTGAR